MKAVVFGTQDGHVVVLDEPLDLPPSTRVRVTIEVIEPSPDVANGAGGTVRESP
jgi:hypothetical protein